MLASDVVVLLCCHVDENVSLVMVLLCDVIGLDFGSQRRA